MVGDCPDVGCLVSEEWTGEVWWRWWRVRVRVKWRGAATRSTGVDWYNGELMPEWGESELSVSEGMKWEREKLEELL